MQVAEVDLKVIAFEVLRELKPELNQQEIVTRVHQYPDVPNVWADPNQIAVALKALVQNSIQAIHDVGGRVEIRLWRKSVQSVGISVRDNGVGIDERAKKHLFDPFFSGREAGRGLGFGLSKAWAILKRMHEGEIRLVDSVGGPGLEDNTLQSIGAFAGVAIGGATFEISLPISLHRPKAVQPERPSLETPVEINLRDAA